MIYAWDAITEIFYLTVFVIDETQNVILAAAVILNLDKFGGRDALLQIFLRL